MPEYPEERAFARILALFPRCYKEDSEESIRSSVLFFRLCRVPQGAYPLMVMFEDNKSRI